MRKFLIGVSTLVLCSMPHTALAQQAEGIETALAQQAEGIEEAASGDIVVTANRVSSLLSKTPLALSAITGESLASSGVTNPTRLGELTPNLVINRDASPAAGGGLQITIRGVTSGDATEKGDPSAAFMRDGIYIARQQSQEVSFYDVERVEVLRGPQGTLYGRNATAGVINLLSVRPKHEFEVTGALSYGSFDAIEATTTVNIPVSSDLAIRAAVNHDQRDNAVIPTVSSIDINPFRKNTSVRLSALADLSETASLYISGDYSWIKGSPFSTVPITNFFRGPFVADTKPVYFSSPARVQRSTNRAIPWTEYRDNIDRGIMGEFNWDLGLAKVTWLASYREFLRDEHRHAGPAATFRFIVDSSYWQHSQEVRLALGGEGLWKAQVGAYYFKESSRIAAIQIEPNQGFFQDPNIAIGKAVFGEGTITPVDGLNFTAGLRYSHDEKSRKGIQARDPLGARNVLAVNDAARTFTKITWRVGADYDVPALGLVYANVSTGYKAGGFNDGCELGNGPSCTLTADQLYYKPETLTAYELGLKWRLMGDIVRINASAFHYDYSGLQLSQAALCLGITCQVTTNAAKAKIDGVELEANIRPARGHAIELSGNWLDARYDDFNPLPTVSFAGLPLSRAPKWSATAGYTYTLEFAGGSLDANARTRISAKYDLTDLSTRVHFYQPSFTKTDVSLTFTPDSEKWSFQVFARNLENAIVLTYARNSAGSEAGFEDPRTLGARATFKF